MIKSELKLGILGLSEGNGHPYSWAAIFNGYNPEVMANCPFPVIPEYLARQNFPQDTIKDAKVTHIWSQSRAISEHIASASLIENIVDDYSDMIELVDAVLLARDDAENHLKMSRPFIEAGLPIFIDKPIALNKRDLNKILALEQYPGQIFSCSALRYAREMQLTKDEHKEMGVIHAVYATTPKNWRTYGVHIIEPVIRAIEDIGSVVKSFTVNDGEKTIVGIMWSSGVMTTFAALGKAKVPLQMIFHGEKSTKEYKCTNTFDAFKASLDAFVYSVRHRKRIVEPDQLERIVDIIERGLK